MKLLDIAAYRELATGDATAVTATPDAIERVLAYATRVWKQVGLAPRKLRASDVTRVELRGEVALFHVRAYPRKRPDTVLAIAAGADGKRVQGHILIALTRDDELPHLLAPGLGVDVVVTEAELRKHLQSLHAELRDPFAVLTLSDGTYMQTLAEAGGKFVLEHQLVNTSSHYGASANVTRKTVVDAMVSYGFGDGEWIDLVTWRRMRL
jgi:hypothetical protein